MDKDAQDRSVRRFNPVRAVIQMATARIFVGPFHYVYNRLKVTGHENVPKRGPFLVVSNHLSYFDPPIVVISVARPMGFVAKKELFSKKLLKPLINFFGAIEVDRDKPSLSTMRTIKRIFQAGWSIGIFIEGTRNKTTGLLGQPHLGPAYLAWVNKVPILPAGILSTNDPKSGAKVNFGKLIQPSPDLDATTWEIMHSISQLTGWELPPRRLQTEIIEKTNQPEAASEV
jgi:1-acyl-sn-glycerol-3-phosphate acyltransferase